MCESSAPWESGETGASCEGIADVGCCVFVGLAERAEAYERREEASVSNMYESEKIISYCSGCD